MFLQCPIYSYISLYFSVVHTAFGLYGPAGQRQGNMTSRSLSRISFWDFSRTYPITPRCSQLLATGRQPGTLSTNSYGKSHTKIWILKGWVQGPGREGSPRTPPFKDPDLLQDFLLELFQDVPDSPQVQSFDLCFRFLYILCFVYFYVCCFI